MELTGLPALIAVIETGSILGASQRLGLSRPTVRRRLEALEASVGVTLLVRVGASLEATDAGRIIAARGREMLEELDTLSRVARQRSALRGSLRVAVPTGLPAVVGRDMLRFVQSAWPGVSLALISSHVPYGDLLDGVDCMITLRLDDPGPRFSCHPLGVLREQLFAAESYLEKHGPITSLEALAGHPIVAWFTRDTGPPTGLPVAGRTIEWDFAFAADAMALLEGWRTEAVTLAPFLPRVAAMAGLPPLAPVLPAVVGRDRPLRLIVAKALQETPVVRSFVEATRVAASALAGIVDPP